MNEQGKSNNENKFEFPYIYLIHMPTRNGMLSLNSGCMEVIKMGLHKLSVNRPFDSVASHF